MEAIFALGRAVLIFATFSAGIGYAAAAITWLCFGTRLWVRALGVVMFVLPIAAVEYWH